MLVCLLILNGGFTIGRLVGLVIGVVPAMQIVPLTGVDVLLLLTSIGVLTKVELPHGENGGFRHGQIISSSPVG